MGEFMLTAVQEEEAMIRDQDVKDLKEGIRDLQKTLHDVDKTVSRHTEKFESLGNIKEQSERTTESTKSAHKRIDKVEMELREEISEIRSAQEKQYKDFKKLVEESNKIHTENYQGIKTFGWKVFFLFATPLTAGFVALMWFIFNKGLGLK
jgi:predicted RNase H-like nuclease (RuvC/YqgF family)